MFRPRILLIILLVPFILPFFHFQFKYSVIASDRTYIIHTDHLGSVVAISDESGNSVQQTSFTPYGSELKTDNRLPITDRGYTGQIKDRYTSLSYYNARYYDPILSRFISGDLIGGGNRFAYVGGNPISRSDPSGNKACDDEYGDCRKKPNKPKPSIPPIQPLQPDKTSGNTYALIPVDIYQTRTIDLPAQSHPDLNLAVRGYEPIIGSRTLIQIHRTETDPLAPQLSGLLKKKPQITSLYTVNDWDWEKNKTGNPISGEGHEITLIGLHATPGDPVYLPASGYNIWKPETNLQAMVLYADEKRITLKYTREDNVIFGYTLHIEGFKVNPELVKLYRRQNIAGREILPAVAAGQIVGTANGDEVKVAIADTGSFIDPRIQVDWWKEFPVQN